jgi:hypothetical protein
MNRLLLFICLTILAFKVAAQPKFRGGDNALNYFLTENLIQVSFNLDKTGRLYNIKIHKGMGIDLDDEAIRVVKLTSGKWDVPPGYNTNENMIIPIRFKAEDTRCQTMNRDNITMAIDAYKSRVDLVNAVTNYYSNKYLGKVDTSKEPMIESLKKQLGLDDEYIDIVLKQAAKKLKENDREGACEDWKFIRNIGSNRADDLLKRYCR